MKSIILSIGFLVLLLLLCTEADAQSAGSLDPTFGTDGTVRYNIQNGGGNAVAVQTDGKVIVAGSTNVNSTTGFVLVRFNANGTLDTTFGTNGVVKTQIFATMDLGASARDLIIQPDGKIIAIGNAQRGAFFPPGTPVVNEVTVVRYNADGSLDTTFDTDGIASTLINGADGYGYDGELQADGKIVVAEFKFAVIRFNANGSLDTSFGTGGIVQTDFGSGYSRAQDLKIQPDGKIVVAGYDNPVGQVFVAAARYNTNGSPDTTFDGDGKLTASIAGEDRGYGLVIQPDGKIVVVGTTQTGFGMMRLLPSGAFDQSFGTGGKVNLPNFGAVGLDVALQADGKIVTAGLGSGSPTVSDFAVARFLPNGSPDVSFDGDGKASVNILDEDTAHAVVIQPNGKIVVGGQSLGGGAGVHLSAARFQAGGNTFADFDGDGKTDISIFRPSNGQWWFLRSSDSSNYALQFGVSTDEIVPADYTGDGKTDVAVFRPSTGEWFVLRSEDLSYYSYVFGTEGDIPAPGDYDGDGRADAAVYRQSSGTWYINKSNGGIQITNFGISSDVPVSADWDGDGKTDIAVYRRILSEWWILRSSNGTVFGYDFGVSGPEKPLPGDYTGDGKADAAFFNVTQNRWYVLRSEGGGVGFYSTVWGADGDVPAPGDYDGDGIFDLAVFRPSNNSWYVRRSTGGDFQASFGTSGDLPVPNAYVRSN